jgi:hypothetical protein
MAYSAAVIPSTDIKNLLIDNWDTADGNLPDPRVVDLNDGSEPIRFDTARADIIIVKIDAPMEEENPIGTWIYGHRRWRILLEITTKVGRVRLWDIKNEVRRICHATMHTMTNFQRIQYINFHENMEDNQLLWGGRISIELVSNAVLLETSND